MADVTEIREDEAIPFDTAVRIKISGETGTVVGMCFYKRQVEVQYLLEYKTADGKAAEDWFFESQIEVVGAELPPPSDD
jgi:hypothetical protein|tara:strand:- start:65 stop:301 length:237 start_codon:yes stop_codon:yes gene_type:complete